MAIHEGDSDNCALLVALAVRFNLMVDVVSVTTSTTTMGDRRSSTDDPVRNKRAPSGVIAMRSSRWLIFTVPATVRFTRSIRYRMLVFAPRVVTSEVRTYAVLASGEITTPSPV